MRKQGNLLKLIVLFSIICIILLSTSIVCAKEYSDLSTSHWAYESITIMSEKGVLSGYPDGTFAPDKPITRAEFAKILVSTLNLTEKTDMKFEDVEEKYWASQYINIASNYLSAYRNGDKYLYMPEMKAVREDVAVAVVNAAGFGGEEYSISTLDRFSDKDMISENLRKYVAIAIEKGLMKGNTNGTFNPKGELTRAEVSQLMINATGVLEKIAVADIQTMKFAYDEITGTIDLGTGWRNYKYSYSTSNKKSGTIYEPSQRVLSYNQYRPGNEQDGARFCGKYVYIMDANDTSKYVKVKVTDPFSSVKYNRDAGTINLGSNWKNFKYSYTIDGSGGKGTIYTPSQKVLSYDAPRVPNSETQRTFAGDWVYVYLKDNLKSFEKIRIYEPEIQEEEEEEEYEFPNFKYDTKTASVDLGDEWRSYKYTYSTSSSKPHTVYTPSQRILSYNLEGRDKVWGNYVFIMDANNTSNYVRIKITDPFANIKYDKEKGTIDLGSNWKNFKYSYTLKTSDSKGTIYTPSQKVLSYDAPRVENSELQSRIAGDLVYVYLKDNLNSYTRINFEKPPVNGFPVFKYDTKTASIDLGVDWMNYNYTYEESSSKPNTVYTPSQSLLSYGKELGGNYAFIMDANDTSKYVRIKITNPFTNIKYDKANGTIDLGTNWKDFKYSYAFDGSGVGTVYTPSQRVLTYGSSEKKLDGNIYSGFGGNSVRLYLSANMNARKTISVSKPLKIGGFEYDESTASVDLGSDWMELKYTYSTSSSRPHTIYTPSQRTLSYSSTGNFGGKCFGGNYLFIMDAENTNNYVKLEISDPFEGIEYDLIHDSIDLGPNWKNFSYAHGSSKEKMSRIYNPSQRKIKFSIESSSNTDTAKTFYGKYVKVYMRYNTEAYTYVEVPNAEFQNAAVRDIINLGIVSGYPDGTFGNTNKVTEAEAVKVIVVMLGKEPMASVSKGDFKGISSNHWANGYYAVADDYGWLEGISGYNPDGYISREKFLKILLNAMGYGMNVTTNNSYINIAEDLGITTIGSYTTTLDRITMAQFLHNALDVKRWGVVSEKKVPISNEASGEVEYKTIYTFGKIDSIREKFYE